MKYAHYKYEHAHTTCVSSHRKEWAEHTEGEVGTEERAAGKAQ